LSLGSLGGGYSPAGAGFALPGGRYFLWHKESNQRKHSPSRQACGFPRSGLFPDGTGSCRFAAGTPEKPLRGFTPWKKPSTRLAQGIAAVQFSILFEARISPRSSKPGSACGLLRSGILAGATGQGWPVESTLSRDGECRRSRRQYAATKEAEGQAT